MQSTKKDDVMIYSNCSNMTEVAEQYAEEVGILSSIPENLQYYFDFEAYGRDMSFEGHFVFTNNGNCIQIFWTRFYIINKNTISKGFYGGFKDDYWLNSW